MNSRAPDKPLIVQSDKTILLETSSPLYEKARDEISKFAELVKSPEHIHTYRITPLSLWNAASSGLDPTAIIRSLNQYSKYDIPPNIVSDIRDIISRYGKIKLIKDDLENFYLFSEDDILLTEIFYDKNVSKFIEKKKDRHHVLIKKNYRGHIKQALIHIGFPIEDLAGFKDGAFLPVQLRPQTLYTRKDFSLRKYQEDASEIFYAGNSVKGGSGVIVLPCGAGKTVVGLKVLEMLKTETLILVTNVVAARQWIQEILDKTTLSSDQIGEYTGDIKLIKPLTLATYQILVYRRSRQDDFIHFDLFNKKNWGLIIYDEVHLLPAPVFRMVAEIQSKRRLGLTATLVREDGRENDVFSLIGPKKFDIPWKELEKQGWIAKALCMEIRTGLPADLRYKYAVKSDREKFRIASTNPNKIKIVLELVAQHKNDNILIIGQYIDQLESMAEILKAPFISGKMRNQMRQELYNKFKKSEIKLLVVSKVANFAVDLPDANVAIQVSGTFGSRQEEAQRLGRILRPKEGENQAHFYTLVTRESKEGDFAGKRQMFLTEQGYRYVIKNR
ncbi:MAG: helicase-associated domain-containing protein [Spirochaetes bacterium]|nr:helicase-associated domain-containing protein [Spirochaetota bacterium]